MKMKKFEYIFNGGNLKLENDIVEIYNNSIFEIKIKQNNISTLICNKQIINKKDDMFTYTGKLNNSQIIIENNNLDCEFSFECYLQNLNFNDNTKFSKLN